MADRIELEISGIRFLWANLITPVHPSAGRGKVDKTKPLQYNATVMIPKAHPIVPELRGKIREALAARFGAAKVPDNFGSFNLPSRCGDQHADKKKADVEAGVEGAGEQEYTRGYWLLSVKSIINPERPSFPLPLAVIINGKGENLTSDNRHKHANDFYWGVEGGCSVSFTSYDPTPLAPHGGCSCWINDAYSLAPAGEKIGGGGRDPAARMSGYAGKSSDVDPTARSASGF